MVLFWFLLFAAVLLSYPIYIHFFMASDNDFAQAKKDRRKGQDRRRRPRTNTKERRQAKRRKHERSQD